MNSKVNILASKTGNLDLTDCDLVFIYIDCLKMSLAFATTPTIRAKIITEMRGADFIFRIDSNL